LKPETKAMIKYTTDHEWIRVEGDIGTVGITAFAQEKLGDLVFVELPAVGASYDKGQTACTVESVKAAADVFAPVGGEIVAANEKVTAEPGLVNTSPMQDGWLFKVRIRNGAELAGLMNEEDYDALEK
jgi:glycine cleavage system H protein